MLIEDPSVFTADWGVDAVLAGQPVVGIFNEPSYRADLGGPGMATTEPTFWLSSHLVPSPAVDAILVVPTVMDGVRTVVKGGTYRVKDPQPDGTGFTLLILEVKKP